MQRSTTNHQQPLSRIALSEPHITGREKFVVADTLATTGLSTVGPHVTAFEAEFAQAIGADYAVAVSSGTAALHLALHAVGVDVGDEVIVSTLTTMASVSPIVYLRARPVFIDSERHSWNMDPDLLVETLRRKARRRQLPKAVVLVHFCGQSADLTPIQAACRELGVALIEDAADSLGSYYDGCSVGTFGQAGIYSFDDNKIITTSGGGMLVSPDPRLVAQARKLATQAYNQIAGRQNAEFGYNYQLSNILAGIGRSQLQVLEERVQARRRVFAYYQDALKELPGLRFVRERDRCRHSRWLTCLTVDSAHFGATSEELRLALAAANIEASPIWQPLHQQPVFAGCEVVGGAVAEELFQHGLCLPSSSFLTEVELARVVKVIQEHYNAQMDKLIFQKFLEIERPIG